MATRVLPDANVLFSRTLRDWLFLLRLESAGDMFTVSTTIDIVAETIARLRDRYPDVRGEVTARIHDQILAFVDDRIDDFAVDGTWPGDDPGDAHVHAAAEHSGIDIVLTCDRGWARMDAHQRDTLTYEAHHPDSFFCLVDTADPDAVRRVVKQQMKYWLDRDGECDLPSKLRAAGCELFAQRVRDHVATMDCSFLGTEARE